jgi:hypothetical protein
MGKRGKPDLSNLDAEVLTKRNSKALKQDIKLFKRDLLVWKAIKM